MEAQAGEGDADERGSLVSEYDPFAPYDEPGGGRCTGGSSSGEDGDTTESISLCPFLGSAV